MLQQKTNLDLLSGSFFSEVSEQLFPTTAVENLALQALQLHQMLHLLLF